MMKKAFLAVKQGPFIIAGLIDIPKQDNHDLSFTQKAKRKVPDTIWIASFVWLGLIESAWPRTHAAESFIVPVA